MKPEELFLQNIKVIDGIARFVSRRNGLRPDQAEEFTQEVKFRLIENNYYILREFKGGSQLSTYLTTVISRMLQQTRVKEWGKWRPSAEAKRIGDKAITLERLLTREGYSMSEAVNLMTPSGSTCRKAELETIYASLPPRNPRPALIAADDAPDVPAVNADPEEPLRARDRVRIAQKAMEAINRMAASLPAEERRIVQMRFNENMKVSDIARRLHLDQKRLYKKFDKLFEQVREALEKAGLRRADIDELLAGGDQELHFDLLE